MDYLYFITTPGMDPKAYIQLSGGEQVCYFKFGDTTKPGHLDIRSGYFTHNPDLGVFACIPSTVTGGYLGTRLKQLLDAQVTHRRAPGADVKVSSEWFAAHPNTVNALRALLQNWERAPGTLDDANIDSFIEKLMAIIKT